MATAVETVERRTPGLRTSPQSATTLFSGPHIGEFAYELLSAGVARRATRRFGKCIVCTRPDRFAIHTDYATECVPHPFQCVGICCTARSDTAPRFEDMAALVPSGATWERPVDLVDRWIQRGEYIVYGNRDPQWKGAIVLHARARGEHCPERNWPRDRWNRLGRTLASRGGNRRLVCIGTKEQAYPVEGCVDMRGVPLQGAMDILRSAWVAIGVSSGPMHLASMCGCPHVVWCGGPERYRTKVYYEGLWNPHRTWVHAHINEAETWQPPFEIVWEWVESDLSELERSNAGQDRN